MSATAPWLLILTTLAGASPAPGTTRAAPAARTVAIVALQPLGTEQQVADRLEEILRAEVSRLRGLQLQKTEHTQACGDKAMAPAKRCDGASACLSAIGAACKVQRVMFGTVASLGDSHVLDLKVVEVRTRSEQARKSVVLSGDKALMIEAVREVSAELLVPEDFVGSLEIRLARPGAEVFVDGQSVGTTPLPPLQRLKPGPHGLKIALKGYGDFDRFVDVRFDRTTVVNVSLSGNALDADIEARPLGDEHGGATAATTTAQPASQGAGALSLVGAGLSGAGAMLALGSMTALGTMYLTMLPYTEKQGGQRVVTDASSYGALVESYRIWPLYWVTGCLGCTGVATGTGLLLWELLLAPPEEP